MAEESTQWLVKLHEQTSTVLFRLATLLGAGDRAQEIVHNSLFALYRRGHRVVDPNERVELLQESVVHLARASRSAEGTVSLPRDKTGEHDPVLEVIDGLPLHLSEHLIVSHYLARFGPELASIMRMTLRRSNRRLETALMAVHQALDNPGSLEATSEQVMGALQASARAIHPPLGDEFEAELAALPTKPRLRATPSTLVVITALALALGFIIATMTRALSPPVQETSPEQPAVTTSPGAQALPAVVLGVPVYYVGRADGLLYPELRDLPASGRLVRSAIEAVFTLAPLDPDFRSAWAPGQLLDVEVEGSFLTLDLSASAYELLSEADAEAAINQVVYTASNLVGVEDLRVRFLADGGPPPAPFERVGGFATDGLTPVAPVRITWPKNLAQQPEGEIEIRGEVYPDFAVPEVTITDTANNRIVAKRFVDRSDSPNQRGWHDWSLVVSLPLGDYDVTVTGYADTEATSSPFSENKLIQVR